MRGNPTHWGLDAGWGHSMEHGKGEGPTGTPGDSAGNDPQGSFLPTCGSPPSPAAFQERLEIFFWAWAYWEGVLGEGEQNQRANVKARRIAVPGETLGDGTKLRWASSFRPVVDVDLLEGTGRH